jgi:SET domain-containing protein
MKIISKTFYDLIFAQKECYKIKKLFFSFKHLYNFLPNKYISSTPKIMPDASFKHSWGIFLAYPCNILSLILEYRGNKITKSFKNKVEFSNRFRRQNLYFFQINSMVTIDATFLGNEGRLINHGCITNCFTRTLKHSNGKFVLIISQKKIGVLEEIVYDYKINIDDTDYDQIQCLCFDVECKKEMMI